MTSPHYPIVIIVAIAVLTYTGISDASPARLMSGGVRLPWHQKATSSSTPYPTQPRGGAAASKRSVMKGSVSSSSPSRKGVVVKKKMKKRVVRKMTGIPTLPPETSSGTTHLSAGSKGDTMPSIFRIPAEEKYDRYAAALAATEGLRRVRDKEIASAEETNKNEKKTWRRRGSGPADVDPTGTAPRDPLGEAKQRAEAAFLLLSTKAVQALGMSVTQFNQIGREVVESPALKERVAEQAYLYRMASAVHLEKVPLLDDPSSRKTRSLPEHKKYRLKVFARSIHEIEDLRADQLEALRQSLRVERFPPGFDLSDPNVQPLLHPEVRRVCEKFPAQAEEIVKRCGLDSDEFNRMLEETKGNPIFRWRVQKYVKGLGGETNSIQEREKEKKS